eukprot:9248096-Pyramimonas_sp.AAC.1
MLGPGATPELRPQESLPHDRDPSVASVADYRERARRARRLDSPREAGLRHQDAGVFVVQRGN